MDFIEKWLITRIKLTTVSSLYVTLTRAQGLEERLLRQGKATVRRCTPETNAALNVKCNRKVKIKKKRKLLSEWGKKLLVSSQMREWPTYVQPFRFHFTL